MSQSYKAGPEHTPAVQGVTAGGLGSSGCHGQQLYGPAAIYPVAQGVMATPQGVGATELKGQSGQRPRPACAAPPLGVGRAAYARVRAGEIWRTRPERTQGACVPLLRGGGRLGSRCLRRTLSALLLRCGVRFGVPLLEVRERIARLLRGQHPSRTLCGGRTRVRLAKVRAYDLPADTERSSKILRAERLDRSHCNHLLPVARIRRTRRHRGVERRTRPIGRVTRSVRCFGGDRCAVHGYSVTQRTQRTQVVTAYTRPKVRRTHVRTVRLCNAYAYVCSYAATRAPRRCLCKRVFAPPPPPPRCPSRNRHASRGSEAS